MAAAFPALLLITTLCKIIRVPMDHVQIGELLQKNLQNQPKNKQKSKYFFFRITSSAISITSG